MSNKHTEKEKYGHSTKFYLGLLILLIAVTITLFYRDNSFLVITSISVANPP